MTIRYAVEAHPALPPGSDAGERALRHLASELAGSLVGGDAPSPIGRLVASLAPASWAGLERLCRGRPFLAVEAGVRTAMDLWRSLDAADRSAPERSLTAERVAQAIQAAESRVGDADRAVAALGRLWPGTEAAALDAEWLSRIEAGAHMLAKLPTWLALADALGRRRSRSEGRSPEGGGADLVGVVVGGDPSRALPSELALLCDPETEDLGWTRWAERRLAIFDLQHGADAPLGERRGGPLVVCIDTSASMNGAPEDLAKGLVLGLARRLVPRGRALHLVLFGGVGEAIERRVGAGPGGLGALLDFLALGFRNGTDFDVPLLRALDRIEGADLRDADILVVTDGLARASVHVVDRVAQARRRLGVRVISAIVGKGETSGVAPFSDAVVLWNGVADAAAIVRVLERLKAPSSGPKRSPRCP